MDKEMETTQEEYKWQRNGEEGEKRITECMH